MAVAAYDEQGGTAGFGDEHRTSRPVHDPAPHRNPLGPVPDPHQGGRDDLVELALGPDLLLGAGWHRLTGDRGFPRRHSHRPQAANGAYLPTGAPDVPQSPPQRGVAAEGGPPLVGEWPEVSRRGTTSVSSR